MKQIGGDFRWVQALLRQMSVRALDGMNGLDDGAVWWVQSE